jgi:hypothetical protein
LISGNNRDNIGKCFPLLEEWRWAGRTKAGFVKFLNLYSKELHLWWNILLKEKKKKKKNNVTENHT